MKIKLLHIILALGAVVLVGCGGGGGSSSSGSTSSSDTLAYQGKTEKAVLTKENTKYFLDLLSNFSQSIDTPSYFKSQKITVANKSTPRLGKSITKNNKVIGKETIDGEISGSYTVAAEETGTYTGKFTYTYSNYSDIEGELYNGTVVNYLTVNDQEIITKNTEEYQLFNVKIGSEDITLDGSITRTIEDTGIKLVENYVVQNNKTAQMLKYDKYQTLLNTHGQAVSFSGKVYDSNYGYVDVSTLAPLAYNANGSRRAEGEVLIEGESSSTTVKYAYDNRVRVEIDNDKDGSADTVQVYREGDYETEVPNEAPLISIAFPQSIYTDTDMSHVKVDVYDPDLDGFTTEYEWSINDESNGTELALDNTLFKKHDILKLVVTATDDRTRDTKSSTEDKEQIVLNTVPVAEIESNITIETIEALEQIKFDASSSTDKDNDPLTYEWKVYKLIPELEHYDEPVIAIIWPEDMDPNGDIVYPDYIIEVNASKYFDDVTLENPTFSANNVGRHIIFCKVYDDDMAEDTSVEINVTIKPLDMIEKSESKLFFPNQENLGEWTFNSPIKAFDLDDDGDKELIYFTNSLDNLTNYYLHVTFDANGEAPMTLSYPVDIKTNLLNFSDFNGDGKTDIYMENHILLQKNDGTFELPFAHNRAIYGTFIDDFNGDGQGDMIELNKCDLIINAPYSNYDVAPLLEYTVKACDEGYFSNTNTLKVADFNNDGIEDFMILTPNSYDGNGKFVIVYKEDNNTLVESSIVHVVKSSGSSDITVGDINGDGYSDIIVDNALFVNHKDNSFSVIENVDANHGIDIIDISNDGINDILYKVTTSPDDTLRVLLQGDNYEMIDFEVKTIIGNTIIEDIDNDGKVEIIENYQNRIEITSFK